VDKLDISEDSISFIKTNKKLLCEQFASIKDYPSFENPAAYFMAGSPGAGKTEFSKSFIEEFETNYPLRKIVRLDADDVRLFIPAYTKHNSSQVQGAAALGVEKLFDCVLKNNQDFLLDATFAHYNKSKLNIQRCLGKGRKVGILYLYQDPLLAWDFTKQREAIEGRDVTQDIFINSFFDARENVQKVKDEFGEKVELWLVIKNLKNDVEKTFRNIDNVERYLKANLRKEYKQRELRKLIK